MSDDADGTPVSPGFADFAKKVNQLADALRPQGHAYYQVGNYDIMAEIGHGGQGIVFHARDKVLNRSVALKVPHLHFLSEPHLQERFLREARSLALLDHPNIVRIYETGEIQGLPYQVFDYCSDGNLTDWLKKNGPKVAPRTAAAWIGQLAQGLQHAHQRNILHRDIKPNNIFIHRRDGGTHADDLGLMLKLGDFGLAKVVDATLSEQQVTLPQERIGTPAYMAPEQVEGQHELLCPATDIYSMGIVLFELLMGRPLFATAGDLASRRRLQPQEPPSLRKEQPGIPKDLEAICQKCLENDPAQRYRHGGELAADLSLFLHGGCIPHRRRWWKVLQRNTQRYPIAIVALMCLAILAMSFVAFGRQSSNVVAVSQVNGHWMVKGQCKEVWAIAFSPNGQLMYFAGDSEGKESNGVTMEYVTVYDMVAHQIVKCFPTHSAMIKNMVVVDDGKTLITGSYDGTVVEWDLDTYKRRHSSPIIELPLVNHDGQMVQWGINTMVASQDGQWIAVGTKAYEPISSMIKVYNRKTGQHYTLPQATICNVNQLFFPESINPSHLYFTSFECNEIMRWDFGQTKPVIDWHFASSVENVAYSSVRPILAWGLHTHRIKLYEWPGRRELLGLGGHKYEIAKMVFSSNAQWLASADITGTVFWWDVSQVPGKELCRYDLEKRIGGLVFSPDGNWLAVGRFDGYVEIIPQPR